MPVRELARRAEPTLNMKNIQGNVVAGFKKPFQTLLFFRIATRTWLGSSWPSPSSPAAWRPPIKVLEHNREVDQALASNSTPPKATWMNLAFSSAGLRKLRNDVDQFADAAFGSGMVQRSHLLGDRQEPGARGNPEGWKVRDDTAHLMVIVAADDPRTMTGAHRGDRGSET